MNNTKIIGSLLLGGGLGALIFSLSLDLWLKILISFVLIIGGSMFAEGNKKEVEEEILEKLNNHKK